MVDQSSSAGGLDKVWNSAGWISAFRYKVGDGPNFGFVGMHECFISDAGSHRKPVEGEVGRGEVWWYRRT